MRGPATLLAASVLFAASVARAEPPPVHAGLDWRREPGAEHCMDAAELTKAVESRLGRRVFVPRSQADVVVRGRLEAAKGGEGWTAKLALESAAGQPMGTRTLSTRAEDCSALDASLALVVALMIDIPRKQLPPPPVTSAPKPAPVPPPTTPIQLPRGTPAPREPWGFEADARGVAALGLMPGVALGVGLGVGVQPPGFWYTELDGALWMTRRVDSASGGYSRFSLQSVSLYLCPLELESPRFRFQACVGQRVGRLVADGFGFDQNRHEPRVVYNPGVRLRLTAGLVGPLELGAGLGLEVPLARDHFIRTSYPSASRANGTSEELYRMAPVVGTAELVLGVRLGRR